MSRLPIKRGYVVVLVLALALPAVTTTAFTLNGPRWLNNTTSFHTDIPLFDARDDWQSAFETAMGTWAPDFNYTIVSTYADPCEVSPVRNGADFRTTSCTGVFGGTTLAVAHTSFSGGELLEADIVFKDDPNLIWDIYAGPHQGSPTDFRRVAVHELGHSLGLGHETVLSAIMQPNVGNLEVPVADDIAGVQALYLPFFRPATLVVGPTADFVPIGPIGGPFVASSAVYRMWNVGTVDGTFGVNWSMGSWLDVNDPNGNSLVDPNGNLIFFTILAGQSTTAHFTTNGSTPGAPTIFTLGASLFSLNGNGNSGRSPQIRVNNGGGFDYDNDGVGNGPDICPFAPDDGSSDTGGFNTSTPDGIGDACQCGDVSDDAIVDIRDRVLLDRHLAERPPGVHAPTKCRVTAGTTCDSTDRSVLGTALAGGPGLGQNCIAATGME